MSSYTQEQQQVLGHPDVSMECEINFSDTSSIFVARTCGRILLGTGQWFQYPAAKHPEQAGKVTSQQNHNGWKRGSAHSFCSWDIVRNNFPIESFLRLNGKMSLQVSSFVLLESLIPKVDYVSLLPQRPNKWQPSDGWIGKGDLLGLSN